MTHPTVTTLVDGVPILSNQGQAAFGSVTLIEGNDNDGILRRIIVDTAHVGRRVLIVDALDERGLTPLDIDYVVGTHAHWDHIQNVDLFTNAVLLMHKDERLYAHQPKIDDWATPSWTGFIIEQLEIEEVGDGHIIIPGVEIMEMTGHSIGSIGVIAHTEQGRIAITSDALHFAWVAQAGENPLVFWDENAARKTIARVMDNSDVVYPGHDAPFRMSKSGEIEYMAEVNITLSGIDPVFLPVDKSILRMPGRDANCGCDQGAIRCADHKRIHEVVKRRYEAGEKALPTRDWEKVSA